jgi:hypothetical protein
MAVIMTLNSKYPLSTVKKSVFTARTIIGSVIKNGHFNECRIAAVQQVNDDGTVDVAIPPDSVLTHVTCICRVSAGDSVTLFCPKGDLSGAAVLYKNGINR